MTATVIGNQSIVEQLSRLDSGRLRAYRDNLAFYQGQQWAAQQRRRDRRLVFNYAKAMVDKTASYLMSGVSFVVDDKGASTENSARGANAEVDRCIQDQMGGWRFPVPKDKDGDPTDAPFKLKLALQPN